MFPRISPVGRWGPALLLPLFFGPLSAAQVTEPVSSSATDAGGNAPSRGPSLSSNGRWVAFSSLASDLVPGDTNGRRDVFVKDRLHRSIVRISVSSGGQQGNGNSLAPSISYDGRHVAFESSASNLVAADANGHRDVFVHDRDPDGNGIYDEGNGTTLRCSVRSNGDERAARSSEPSLSGSGRFVAYTSEAQLDPGDLTSASDVYIHDRDPDANGLFDEGNGQTVLISIDSTGQQGALPSGQPSLSEDGRRVAFVTLNALDVADQNGVADVFVRDRDPDGNGVYDEGNGLTHWSSRGPGGSSNGPSSAPSLSGDGLLVAFQSAASDLVAGDGNGVEDVFRAAPDGSGMVRVSVWTDGTEASAPCSAPAISHDGLFIAFESEGPLSAADLDGLTDVYLHQRRPASTFRVNVQSFGGAGNAGASGPAQSAFHRLVAFASTASDLHPADPNSTEDVFVHGRQFSFAIDPPVVNVPGAVSLQAWRGPPGNRAIVFVTGVNGVFYLQRIGATRRPLDGLGRYVFPGVITQSFGGIEVELTLIAQDERGKWVTSNEARLRVQ